MYRVIHEKNHGEMYSLNLKDRARQLKEAFIGEYSEAIVPTHGRVGAEYRKDVCMNLLRDFLDSTGYELKENFSVIKKQNACALREQTFCLLLLCCCLSLRSKEPQSDAPFVNATFAAPASLRCFAI